MTNKTVLSVVNLFVVSAFLTTAYGASEYKNITNAQGVTTPALVRSTGNGASEYKNITNAQGVTTPAVLRSTGGSAGKVKQEWENITDSNGNTRRVPINPNMR